jgi:hypothetical protein
MGEHFTKVFNNHRDIDPIVLEELDQCPIDKDLGKPPTSGEIAHVLRKTANSKAPGESVVTGEALKALDGIPFNILKDFLISHFTLGESRN